VGKQSDRKIILTGHSQNDYDQSTVKFVFAVGVIPLSKWRRNDYQIICFRCMNREVCRKVMSPYTHEADYLPISP
jgi:hypothetical protein